MSFPSNYLIHFYIIIFGILLQLLVEVKSQFKPESREAHTTTFINDKLYIFSGYVINDTIPPKEPFLYLDASVPFNTDELKWHSLSSGIVPPHEFAASVKGGANNNTLFLYGGGGVYTTVDVLVYTFDTQDNSWRVPVISGIPPNFETAEISGINPTIDYDGLMYLFSGASRKLNYTYITDMFILDTINLGLKKANAANAPRSRVLYGVVFLPNQNIIYMGGYNNGSGAFALDEVYLYDTKNDVWATKTTYGSVPSARYSISSVLGLDGQRVIIYGGLGQDGQIINPESSVYVLDINNYNWYLPKISGKIPSGRSRHNAVLIGKYMVVTFGSGYTQGIENDILLLDISNNDEYIWTTYFEPPAPPVIKQPQIKIINNTGFIVGTVLGSLVGGILLAIGSFFLYKRYKKKRKAIPTPGNASSQEILQIPGDERNDGSQEILQIAGDTKDDGSQEILQISGEQSSQHDMEKK